MNYYLDVLKKYAVFQGRARRKEYWMFVLFNAIAWFILGIIGSIIRTSLLGMIYGLVVLVPCLAVLVRRLHDTGRSGWWVLLLLIPILGSLAIIIFAVIDSQHGENKYGPNPKDQPVTI